MIRDSIQNGLLSAGARAPAGNGPPPAETGQRKQYLDSPTRRVMDNMAPYSTDFFGAQVQGLDPEDFGKTDWYEIRAADTFPSATISENSRMDDWKTIGFRRKDIGYVPWGAKLWFWKSCWLAYNPSNIGSVLGTAVVRRCNRNWKRYDYYGNILSEPFVVDKAATRANSNEYNATIALPDHYSNCVMQANPETLGFLKENTRIVMGSAVYAVRGLSDYILEYSTEEDSVRLLYFSLYFQEPTERDDMINQIADGKAFSWVIRVDGSREVGPGRDTQFTATSLRCGQTPDRPVGYQWESLSPELAVDENGVVTGLSQGLGTIRCRLKQNPDIYTDVTIAVRDARLAWATSVPGRLPVYQPVTLTVQSEPPVTWVFEGPPQNYYEAKIQGTSVTLVSYYPSGIPLKITVTGGGETLTTEILLTAR